MDPARAISTSMGSMPPELMVLHELRVLLIDRGALRTAEDIGLQHSALHGKAAFRQVLPGMPLNDRCPLSGELIRAGLQAVNTAP